MTTHRRRRFVIRVLIWALPGGMILTTSCGRDVRNALTDAGTTFLAQSASDLLQALFPVADWVADQNQTA